ncbi:hypothetical protein ACQZV8_19530 [Magnetococcales bacterium HHB-1]
MMRPIPCPSMFRLSAHGIVSVTKLERTAAPVNTLCTTGRSRGAHANALAGPT